MNIAVVKGIILLLPFIDRPKLWSANTLTMPRKRYDANCTLQTSSRVVRARLQRFMTVVAVSLVIEVWLLDCLVQLGGKPDGGDRIARCESTGVGGWPDGGSYRVSVARRMQFVLIAAGNFSYCDCDLMLVLVVKDTRPVVFAQFGICSNFR